MFRAARFVCHSLAVLAGFGLATAANAYQVTPMIYDLKPSGSAASTTVRVNNDSDGPITIEIVAEKREFDELGNDKRTPADADFIIFPPQAVIAPNKVQAIRVQYVGAAKLDTSVMYTVMIKQVPVQLPNAGPSGVQLVFNFGTVANIVPDGAKPAVEVVSLTANEKGYELRLRNKGAKYANLALAQVVLSNAGNSVTLKDETWRGNLRSSWLLPGQERVIQLPQQAGLGASGVTAKFESSETGQDS